MLRDLLCTFQTADVYGNPDGKYNFGGYLTESGHTLQAGGGSPLAEIQGNALTRRDTGVGGGYTNVDVFGGIARIGAEASWTNIFGTPTPGTIELISNRMNVGGLDYMAHGQFGANSLGFGIRCYYHTGASIIGFFTAKYPDIVADGRRYSFALNFDKDACVVELPGGSAVKFRHPVLGRVPGRGLTFQLSSAMGPVITFPSGGGTGAVAVANVSPIDGGIDSLTILEAGSGYTNGTYALGFGSGAAAGTYTVTGNVVTSTNITTRSSNYTSSQTRMHKLTATTRARHMA